MGKIREWFREQTKIPTTTLVHCNICFRTNDGIPHRYCGLNYINPAAINCSVLEYYLIGKDYLKDDDGILYPMTNVSAVWAKSTDTIKNVKVIDYKVWYSADDIEVLDE